MLYMLDTSIFQLWHPLRLLLRYDGDSELKTQASTQQQMRSHQCNDEFTY
jgi:TfoX/Sxy family transcriptional regulator of competence genes